MQAELDLVAHARRTDPATSHEAAASLSSEKLRDSQAGVLTFLRAEGPMTDAQMVALYPVTTAHYGIPVQSESGLRTRRKELVTAGKVRAVGTTVMPSGRRAIVWGVAE